MGLLLLVDLDGVVYRGADPVPGRRRGPRRSRGPWRRRRVRDQQLDALPRRLRDPARRDGRAGHRRDGRLVRPGDRALPRRPRAGHPPRAGPRRGRARARAARRGPRRRDRRARRDPDEPGGDRRLDGRRRARCRRRSGSTRTSPTCGSPPPPTASAPAPGSSPPTATRSTRRSAACGPAPGRIVAALEAATGVVPRLDRQARRRTCSSWPREAVGRDAQRGGDDRRRDRARTSRRRAPSGRAAS